MNRRTRIILLAIAVVVTAVCAATAPLIPFSADVTDYLPPDDPAVKFWLDMTNRFGALDILMVGLEEPGEPLQQESLHRLARMTNRLVESKPQGVLLARSMTNLSTISQGEDGTINTDLLMNKSPESVEDLEALERRILSDTQVRGSFVSEDLRAYVIIVRVDPDRDGRAVASLVQEVVEEERGEMKAIYFGAPFIAGQITSRVYQELPMIIALFVGLLLVPLVLFSGKLVLALTVVGCAGISLVWWLSLLQVFRVDLTTTASGAALVLLPLGSLAFARVAELRMRGGGAGSVPRRIIGLLLAGAVGFGILSFFSMPYLSQFGRVAGLGMVALAACCLLLLMPLLSFFKPTEWSTSIRPTLIRPATAWVTALLILVGSTAATLRTRFYISPRDIFAPEEPVGLAMGFFDQHFGGADLLQISVLGDLREPANAARLMRLTDLLEGNPLFLDVRSVSQVLGMLNEQFGGLHRIPPARAALGNLWFFLEGNPDVRPLVRDDRNEAMIAARIFPNTEVAPQNWAETARAAVRASAAVGAEAAQLRLKALCARYGMDMDDARIIAVVNGAMHQSAGQLDEIRDRVLRELHEYMLSDESPFEPTDAEWTTMEGLLRADAPGSLTAAVGKMESFLDMEYPAEVAGDLSQTLFVRKKALTLGYRADLLLAELMRGAGSGDRTLAFSARARGVLVDMLDPAALMEDSAEIQVSGFPAVISLVDRRLVEDLWLAALVVWLVAALVLLALFRSPRRWLRPALASLLATVLTFALGWLFRVNIDSGCAILYLLPPVASFLLSYRLEDPPMGRARFRVAIALGLAAAPLSLLVTETMPMVRIGAVMAIGLCASLVVSELSRRATVDG